MIKPKQKFDFLPTIETKPKSRNRVDLTGYTRMETRVVQLLLAGQKLNRARTELFDTTEHNPDPNTIFAPVLRRQDFDLADASELSRKLGNRLYDIQRRTEAHKNEILQLQKQEQQNKDSGQKQTVENNNNEALQK